VDSPVYSRTPALLSGSELTRLQDVIEAKTQRNEDLMQRVMNQSERERQLQSQLRSVTERLNESLAETDSTRVQSERQCVELDKRLKDALEQIERLSLREKHLEKNSLSRVVME